jgi:hypothetical protein
VERTGRARKAAVYWVLWEALRVWRDWIRDSCSDWGGKLVFIFQGIGRFASGRWEGRKEGLQRGRTVLGTDLLRRGLRGGSRLSRCRPVCIGRFYAGGLLFVPFFCCGIVKT